MSQTAITKAFEQLKAQQAANGSVLVLDEFVFAYVPDLDPNAAIDRNESWPAASQIVARLAVSKTGRVNDNAVVYSVAMGADVGDFEFNWIGLINKASSTVCMIVHAPVQKKIKTASGQQGNVLTRSFLMEYDGAAQQTQITTPVDTWQIDFTARLNGGDERVRRENVDLWGAAGFIGDGFQVSKSGTKYSVKNGAGYVAGLRAELLAAQDITVTTKPSKVWLDVCWRGTLTSEWQVVSKITVAETLADYYSGDEKHYVFAIAEIAADDSVIDLRPAGNETARDLQPVGVVKELSELTPSASTLPWFDSSKKLGVTEISEFMRLLLKQASLGKVTEYLSLGALARLSRATVATGGTGADTAEGARANLLVPKGVDKQMCTAWVNFYGVGGASIRDSYNVSSVTRLQQGRYQINFSTPMNHENYVPVMSVGDQPSTGSLVITVALDTSSSPNGNPIKKDITGVIVQTKANAIYDVAQGYVSFFGGV